MSYARPQITTRIIPRTTDVAVRPGLTVLIGRPDSGVSEYANGLEKHPQHERMRVFFTAYCDKHVQRDYLMREAFECAERGDVVFLELIGPPSIDIAIRGFFDAGISTPRLQKVLSMIITFRRQNGRVSTEVHRVEVNKMAPFRMNRPFVGC